MTVGGAERSDLVLALHSGERETERWRRFLSSLARLCAAEAAALAFARVEHSLSEAVVWAWPPVTGDAPQFPEGASRIRPGRVYALEELIEPPDILGGEEAPHEQAGGMRFGRLLHVVEPGAWRAWLAVYRRVGDLAATDSVLLTALAPHLAVAMGNFAQLENTRLRAAIAEDLLSRAQIGYRTVAPDGRVICASPGVTTLALSAGDEPREAARLTAQVSIASAIHITQAGQATLAVPIASSGPAARAPSGATLIVRDVRDNASTADALKHLWSLTPSEARLVVALAAGKNLAAAAETIGVTIETARNYSKRIYSKTAANGQADLVRLALTSVAALA